MRTTPSPLSILVIGASRGIGAAIATAYADAGNVVVGSHRGSGVPSGVIGVLADITSTLDLQAAVSRTVEEGGRLDVLVIASGVTHDGLLLGMSEEAIASVFAVNAVGPILAMKAALRPMLRQRSGSIIAISSISAELGVAGQVNYTAAKGALNSAVRSVAKEYASRGIRANIVSPGPTDTAMFASTGAEARAALEAAIPLGRLARPEEIADAVMKVASMTFVTGATLPVAGGLQLGS